MHRNTAMTTRTIITSVAAAAAMTLGATLGGCGSNSSAPAANGSDSQSVARDHNLVDIAFAQGMIPHHAQAIAMAGLAPQRAESPQVKDLAARIQSGQQPEMDQMSRWLHAWHASVPATNNPMDGMEQGDMGQMDHDTSGVMPGMMSGDEMHQLEQATGPTFDRMFLQMMITHHQGAITMAQTAEVRAGQNPDARALAQHIIDTQQREIKEMQVLLGG
ncbi:MAG: DUF305 domain-containing protein [Actinomycetota bacterium]|nr:DUF305 domain-containing protein [Actinomycetota bacterium]